METPAPGSSLLDFYLLSAQARVRSRKTLHTTTKGKLG